MHVASDCIAHIYRCRAVSINRDNLGRAAGLGYLHFLAVFLVTLVPASRDGPFEVAPSSQRGLARPSLLCRFLRRPSWLRLPRQKGKLQTD